MKKNNIYQEAQKEALNYISRRHFLQQCGLSLGGMALGSFLSGCSSNGNAPNLAADTGLIIDPINPFTPRMPHFAPKAKSIIYLHMAGAPSQLELFDYKPELTKMDGQSCPPSFLEGKKFAFIRGVPKMLGQQAQFSQYGQSGAWVSSFYRIYRLLLMKFAF